MDDDSWPKVANFGVGWFLFWLTVLGAVIALNGCASAPKAIMVPHICGPSTDSVHYQKCLADCPEGGAFVVESAKDVSCVCRKNPSEM